MSVKNIVRVSGVTKDFDLGKLVVNVLKGIDLEIEQAPVFSHAVIGYDPILASLDHVQRTPMPERDSAFTKQRFLTGHSHPV